MLLILPTKLLEQARGIVANSVVPKLLNDASEPVRSTAPIEFTVGSDAGYVETRTAKLPAEAKCTSPIARLWAYADSIAPEAIAYWFELLVTRAPILTA